MTSVAIDNKPQTVQQRSVEATRRLKDLVGLDDLKLLSTALAEVAVDEASQNPEFTKRIQRVYEELAALKPSRPASRSRSADPVDDLVPIVNTEGLRFDAYGPLDPYFLKRVYGPAQLRKALGRYSRDRLKEAAGLVQERELGTKPKSKSRIDDLIDYIVLHVAGHGY